MKKLYGMLFCVALLAVSCIEDVDNSAFFEKYTSEFSNRTSISVRIASENPGEYVSLYFANPYEEGSLVKEPVLTGVTPIATTLDVPNDAERIYVLSQGNMTEYAVADLNIVPNGSPLSRASELRAVSADVMTAVNSIYFPEKTNNVRGDTFYKCTDIKIAETPATSEFEVAEVWLTFLGDGGCRASQLYGKLWFYTYPSDKQNSLTTADCTFYGVKSDEVVEVPYSDLEASKNWVFYTKDEFKSNIASYKRFKLGEFGKGVNVGFAYIGNSTVGNKGLRFTTPRLNPVISSDFSLTYKDKSATIVFPAGSYLANGFICHVTVGEFQGNVLGMENRIVTEGDKYDGDYNDILCLVESNPKAIAPVEDVEIGNTDKPAEEIACKTTSGFYLFEDNYPYRGDFDFNDAVIRYEIKDYYESKNNAKQVTVQAYAIGAGMPNSFGFRTSTTDNSYSPLLTNLGGYHNVYPTQTYEPIGEPVVQSLYGTIVPCMLNGSKYYIYQNSFNTVDYPCVLDIPLSDPDDPTWHFEWAQESVNIDDCYHFLKNPSGNARAKDWYKYPKNKAKLFKR